LNPRPVELTFDPVDNQRLARLCGALDQNLRQIEAALDVSVARRGSKFALYGESDNATLAADTLRHFYLQADRDLTTEDIQLGIIEMTHPVSQVDVPDETPALLTRRGDLHGRTPNQTLYLKHIQEHDITFGVGPAGTGKTYLAVACAVDALERDAVKRIVLVRPAVEAGENSAFCPAIWRRKSTLSTPLYDALYDLMGFDRVTKVFERGAIEIAPLAFAWPHP
jgi:phosphate starvation-inducible PhoH-like protein